MLAAWNIKIKQIKNICSQRRFMIIKEEEGGFRGTVTSITSILWISIMCWETWFHSFNALYPFFSWTLLLDRIPAHGDTPFLPFTHCVLIQRLPLEFVTYSPTLRLSWAGMWVPLRSEELEKATGESKDANGSSQLSRMKGEREKIPLARSVT